MKTTCCAVYGQQRFLDYVEVENVFLSTFIGRKLLKTAHDDTVFNIYLIIIAYVSRELIFTVYFNMSLHVHVRGESF